MKRNKLKLRPVAALYTLPAILRTLLRDEAIGGKLVIAASLLALFVANSSFAQSYDAFWHKTLTIGINDFSVSLDLRHWVSEGLMALFFLVIGLEIKREIVKGQLRQLRTALLPIGAAVGGMIVPACIFIALNLNQEGSLNGWAIPVATDIAFALAVMSLLGSRVSSSLRVFLLTLAIVDDIGAIILIALFYGEGLHLVPLLVALVIVLGLFLVNNSRHLTLAVFIVVGVGFWIATYKSGIHPSIAGAFLGLLAPLKAHEHGSVAERLERYTIPLSTFLVVPLFAFANLGIKLSFRSFDVSGSTQLMAGIILGLVLGKVIGIGLASWILVKLKLADLPLHSNWIQVIGVGFIAGIGFTVSVFITELAFDSQQLTDVAKLSIIIASTLSAIVGYVFLRHRKKVEAVLDA